MRVFFAFSLLGLCFLAASCATLGPKDVDARGRNGIERSLQKVVGLSDETDHTELAPPPYELLAGTGEAPPAPKAESKKSEVKKEVAAVSEKSASENEIKPDLEAPAPVKPQVAEREQNDVITPDLPEGPNEVEVVPEAAKKAQVALQRYQELKREDKPLIPKNSPDRRMGMIKNPFKEKFPGVIAFTQNESNLQTSSRGTLDKLANFLAENPNQTLMLQAQMGEGETFDLADVRYHAIQGYLENHNIPQDRILLDEKRMSGDWPEFRMYLLQF